MCNGGLNIVRNVREIFLGRMIAEIYRKSSALGFVDRGWEFADSIVNSDQ